MVLEAAEFVSRVNRAMNLLGLGFGAGRVASALVESGETPEQAYMAVKAAKVMLRPDIALDETMDG